jgi:photosystem II stability/assembly factor-like uncharacterized protein
VRFFLISLLFLFDSAAGIPWWSVKTSGRDTNLRGISAVRAFHANGKPFGVVWASGSNGVVLQSLDGGKSWQQLPVPGGEKLDFRGVVAFNEKIAYLMSSGEGDNSRIYKTADAGKTWAVQYTGSTNQFFLDSLCCISENNCLALGDPVDGKFLLLHTTDGQYWSPLPRGPMPPALDGEGAFAASNSSLVFTVKNEIYFGTGGPAARVFHSADLGFTWTVSETPIAHSNAASGIFALRLGDDHRLVAVGGNYQHPDQSALSSAYSLDGGATWRLSAQFPGGYRSGLAQIDKNRWIALGPTGSDVTRDNGIHWKPADSLALNSASILDNAAGWAVGPRGTIAGLVNHFPHPTHPRFHRHKTRP